MKWLLRKLKIFWQVVPKFYLITGLIAIIVGLFVKSIEIGVLTFLGIILLFVIFLWLRQIYWWFFSKGDYED